MGRLMDRCDAPIPASMDQWVDPLPCLQGCAVPGCRQPPVDEWLPLCAAHRACPRCGERPWSTVRGRLECCGFLVALVPRRAWAIPWRRILADLEIREGWPHRLALARIVVDGEQVAPELPWLIRTDGF